MSKLRYGVLNFSILGNDVKYSQLSIGTSRYTHFIYSFKDDIKVFL